MRSQLRTLSKDASDGVARHLIAAGRLVDEDPQAALQHARAARVIGARVAVVREAVGETAYAAGEWAEAIAELRTARRMTGDDSALPMIADSERALGRADRALRLAQSEEAQALEPAARAEMRIVEAGARNDLGQLDAALLTLEDAGLVRTAVQPWSARVWYAYADLLLTAGRADEAREWFAAAASVDEDGATDADDRLLQLDGIEIFDAEDDLDGEEIEDGGTGADGDGDISDAQAAAVSDKVAVSDEVDDVAAGISEADAVDEASEVGASGDADGPEVVGGVIETDDSGDDTAGGDAGRPIVVTFSDRIEE